MSDTSAPTTQAPATHRPSEVVLEKLDDPGVAAALVTLLDNAELLSTLTIGLSGFIARGDFIMEAVAEGVNDLKKGGGPLPTDSGELPKLADMVGIAQELSAAGPALSAVLNSAMVQPEVIGLLSMVSEAATEGVANAQASQAKVGTIGLAKSLRDDDVQRGLGMVIEIARALGQRLAR
ncbi:MAG: DUF1641 domain-containing protein [Acidimicrobiales bacterium]